eukprot:EG_transcript_35440
MRRAACAGALIFALVAFQSLPHRDPSTIQTPVRDGTSGATRPANATPPADPSSSETATEVAAELLGNPLARAQVCQAPKLPRHKLLVPFRVASVSGAKCGAASVCPSFTQCAEHWSLCSAQVEDMQREPNTTTLARFTNVLLSSQGHVFTLVGPNKALLSGTGGCAEKVPLTL